LQKDQFSVKHLHFINSGQISQVDCPKTDIVSGKLPWIHPKYLELTENRRVDHQHTPTPYGAKKKRASLSGCLNAFSNLP
jgi:hypothetical protein